MNSTKKALTVAGLAIGALALAMFLFYFVKDRTRKAENEVDTTQNVEMEQVKEEKPEFVGIYSPQGPLEANGKRISFFQVNRREDGGWLGAAKVDTVGEETTNLLNCVDVRIEDKEFFLKCVDAGVGMISLSGSWSRGEPSGIHVSGKVLWEKDGTALIDTNMQFVMQQ